MIEAGLKNAVQRSSLIWLITTLLSGLLLSTPGHADPGASNTQSLEHKAAQEAANKALVQRWLTELWHEGRFDVAEELLATNFRRHSSGYPAVGPAAYAAIVKSCHDGFPDTQITQVDDLIADGDQVFVRWRWTGTHKAEFRGIPATDRSIDVLGEDVIRIVDGQITDIWPLFDPLRLMLQIGAIAPVDNES